MLTRLSKLISRSIEAAAPLRPTREQAPATAAPFDRSLTPAFSQTFAYYRIIGNDLPPRHDTHQTIRNVEFMVAHEHVPANVTRCFILNRIVDGEKERRIIDILRNADVEFIRIPFLHRIYDRLDWNVGHVNAIEIFHPAKDAFLQHLLRAKVSLYRNKINYALDVNGARNAALLHGGNRADWVMPWDGNCFLNRRSWTEINQLVEQNRNLNAVTVPMYRVRSNREVLDPGFDPGADDEPQIICRNTLRSFFNEALPYGHRDKVELFWHAGVTGPWDAWRDDPWDPARRRPLEPGVRYRRAGWVARLESGAPELERPESKSYHLRGVRRSEATLAFIEDLETGRLATLRDRHELLAYREGRLEGLKREGPQAGRLTALLRSAAETRIGVPVSTVTDKPAAPPGGEIHDYFNMAPYFWPDVTKPDGIPYIYRDGEFAPGTKFASQGSERFDRTRCQTFLDTVTILALAARITGERRFAVRAAEHFRAWFVSPSTRMNPHLEFSQIEMSRRRGRTTPSGIIEFKDIYFALDALAILKAADCLDGRDATAIDRWLGDYLDWLLGSDLGRRECASINNHGTWYEVQVLALAGHLRRMPVVLESLIRTRHRMLGQFGMDGRQVEEQRRRDTAHYCCYNMSGWIVLARLAETFGINLWEFRSTSGGGIRSGLNWLLATWDGGWPYPQSAGFDAARIEPMRLVDTASAGVDREGAELEPEFSPDYGIMPFWRLAW